MLAPFLTSLTYDDRFQVSVRDVQRLNMVLRTQGAGADLSQLRAILRAVLVCSDDERRMFDRRFDEFFVGGGDLQVDVAAALQELRTLGTSELPEAEAVGSSKPITLDVQPIDIELDVGQVEVATRPLPTREELPLIELIDEQPLLLELDDEQLGEWIEKVEPAKFDPEGPTVFNMGMVHPRRLPMLSDEQLNEAADSLGFFISDTFSSKLDVPRSIDATLQHGGRPVPRFESRRQLLSLALLIDRSCRDLQWNTVPQELAAGLPHCGVSVSTFYFHGVPDRFSDSRGKAIEIDDLEEIRRQLIVLLIGDGHGMFRQINRRPLERMSRWPRVAWLDPRPPGLWDLSYRLAERYKLPIYPCDGPGVIQCLQRFTSEAGPSARVETPLADVGRQRRAIRGRDDCAAFLKRRLSDQRTLEFAQACAAVRSISLGWADRLRDKFFQDLSSSVIGELVALPRTSVTSGGICFDNETRKFLLEGFENQETDRKEQIAEFLAEQIHTVADGLPPDSLAALQARFQAGLVRSLVPESDVDTNELVSIWRIDELTNGTDLDVQAVAEHIESPQLRRVAGAWLGEPPPVAKQIPKNLVRIPAGEFWMGDPSEQGHEEERPRHQVYVSEFFLEKHPVTWELWQRIHSWAVENGYEFGSEAAGKGDDHPVQNLSWFDAIKWCNARSEMEHLEPCYFEDADFRQVYRSDDNDLASECVNWDANGYRLPTEAEWEKAARGGLDGQHFPWPSPADETYEKQISREQANYREANHKGTSPIGSSPPNDFGLLDMAGNVDEWCWDASGSDWYQQAVSRKPNTRGVLEPTGQRVFRGGSWADGARIQRCSHRFWSLPGFRDVFLGFRVIRGRLSQASRERVGEPETRDESPGEATSERSSPSAQVIFVRADGTAEGEVFLQSEPDVVVEAERASSSKRSMRIAFDETVALSAGNWQTSFSAPGFEAADQTIELPAFYQREYQVSLRPLIPENLARIPAGEVWIGDPSQEGQRWERPRHRVFVSEFFLEKYPVTWNLWQRVHAWAVEHGYEFGDKADDKGDDHPVQNVTWFGAVKWCNARSEMERLTPCYYHDAKHNEVYRVGDEDLNNSCVAWDVNGYRLATDAEWEKAARGGLDGQHFPWQSPADQPYDELVSEKHANYGGKRGGTTPVGEYDENGLGLFDMTGNVLEWCWDVGHGDWYAQPEAENADTLGPSPPNGQRVYRGGGWAGDAWCLRCSYRLWRRPRSRLDYLGFRVARGRLGPEQGERVAEREVRDEPPGEATSERSSRGILARLFSRFRRS